MISRIVSTSILLFATCAFYAYSEERMSLANDYYGDTTISEKWWQGFNDTMLDSLIHCAIEQNLDVSIAAKKIAMSRNAITQASSSYYPNIVLSASWNSARSAGNSSSPAGPSGHSSSFALGGQMSWEVDLFGRIMNSVRQSKTELRISKADYESTLVSLCAEVATNYIQLREFQTMLAVANDHMKSQKKVLDIARIRYETGLVSKLDYVQASSVYHSTEATLPSLRTSIEARINALMLLLNNDSETLHNKLSIPAPIPDYHFISPTSINIDLLRRRPDVRAAELAISSAADALGIARKEYYPILSLVGEIGLRSHNLKDIGQKNSFYYSIAPTLSWTLFDGFSRRAAVADARLRMESLIDSYNLTLQGAITDSRTALINFAEQLNVIDSYEITRTESSEAFTLSLDQYKLGLTDFTTVATAQQNFLDYTTRLVEAKCNASLDLIQIYRAIGGAWFID